MGIRIRLDHLQNSNTFQNKEDAPINRALLATANNITINWCNPLFYLWFWLNKKKVQFYFPFSLHQNYKKSRGEHLLIVALLIVVNDVLLKSFSLIPELWID